MRFHTSPAPEVVVQVEVVGVPGEGPVTERLGSQLRCVALGDGAQLGAVRRSTPPGSLDGLCGGGQVIHAGDRLIAVDS
jgi:hypothetical protein